LFKEVSDYNKLTKAKTTEKLSNLLINSVAHNLYTPLTHLVSLTKMLKIQFESGIKAENTIGKLGVCLQRLIYITNNILDI